jgi:hypothetical protein
MRNFLAIMLGVFILAIWLIVLLLTKEIILSLIIGFFVALLLGGEGALIWFFLGRFTKVKVSIGDDAIIYTNYKGSTVIKYEDITNIEFPSIKYTGGWIKINSWNKNIRLTVVIENIQALLSELKDQLDKRGLQKVYNEEKYFSFLKTATFSDESWQRIYRIWWKLLLLSVATTAVGITIKCISGSNTISPISFAVIPFIFPYIVYFITEIRFGRSTAKLADRKSFSISKPDSENESSTYKKAFIWGTILYVIYIAAIFIL